MTDRTEESEKTGAEFLILPAGKVKREKIRQAVKDGARTIFITFPAADKKALDEAERAGAVAAAAAEGLAVLMGETPAGKSVEDAIPLSVNWGKWKAGRILARYSPDAKSIPDTDPLRALAKEDALNFATSPRTEFRNGTDAKGFVDAIAAGLDIPIEVFAEEIEAHTYRRQREATEKDLRRLLTAALEGEEDAPSTIKDLEEGLHALRLRDEKSRLAPQKSLADHLAERQEKEDARTPGDLLGYRLTKFNTIEKDVDGIQPGLYIVGADTNIGKTAFLTNLFLDLLESNPETRGIYFSFDDSKDVIITRLLGIEAKVPLNAIQKKTDGHQGDMKENAYKKLTALAASGRLDTRDLSEVASMDVLELLIREKAEENLFIVIDGLHNVDVGGGAGIREENIARAGRIKGLVDTYRIPIIATAELRKPERKGNTTRTPSLHDLMESGKYAYNANLVWILYPADEESFRETEDPVLMMRYDKNKLSPYKGTRSLRFLRAQGRIEEERTRF